MGTSERNSLVDTAEIDIDEAYIKCLAQNITGRKGSAIFQAKQEGYFDVGKHQNHSLAQKRKKKTAQRMASSSGLRWLRE